MLHHWSLTVKTPKQFTTKPHVQSIPRSITESPKLRGVVLLPGSPSESTKDTTEMCHKDGLGHHQNSKDTTEMCHDDSLGNYQN
jgi:hypothetical protein